MNCPILSDSNCNWKLSFHVTTLTYLIRRKNATRVEKSRFFLYVIRICHYITIARFNASILREVTLEFIKRREMKQNCFFINKQHIVKNVDRSTVDVNDLFTQR